MQERSELEEVSSEADICVWIAHSDSNPEHVQALMILASVSIAVQPWCGVPFRMRSECVIYHGVAYLWSTGGYHAVSPPTAIKS